jgi:hypothetical protein
MELLVLLLIAGATIAADVFATRVLMRDNLLSPSQRTAQLLMVWLVPIFGAAVVIGMHQALSTAPRAQSTFPRARDTDSEVDRALAWQREQELHSGDPESDD